MDSSGSVGSENFELEKQLVSSIVDRFIIGENGTKVAVITYSGVVRTDFLLNDHLTNGDAQRAIEGI